MENTSIPLWEPIGLQTVLFESISELFRHWVVQGYWNTSVPEPQLLTQRYCWETEFYVQLEVWMWSTQIYLRHIISSSPYQRIKSAKMSVLILLYCFWEQLFSQSNPHAKTQWGWIQFECAHWFEHKGRLLGWHSGFPSYNAVYFCKSVTSRQLICHRLPSCIWWRLSSQLEGDKKWLVRKKPDTHRRKLAKWPSLNVLWQEPKTHEVLPVIESISPSSPHDTKHAYNLGIRTNTRRTQILDIDQSWVFRVTKSYHSTSVVQKNPLPPLSFGAGSAEMEGKEPWRLG